MSIVVASILSLMVQNPPVVSVCDIQREIFAPYTEVVVEGRYLRTMHAVILQADGCQVFVRINPDVAGAQAEAFADAISGVSYSDLWERTNVTVLIRGRILETNVPMIVGAKAPVVAASEVLEVSIREGAAE